jgi:uncharacterized membrane protein
MDGVMIDFTTYRRRINYLMISLWLAALAFFSAALVWIIIDPQFGRITAACYGGLVTASATQLAHVVRREWLRRKYG